MKRFKTLMAIIISVSVVVGLSGCSIISKTPEGQKKTVVATVNGEKITVGDVEKRAEPQKAQMELYYGSDVFTKQPDQLTQLYTQILDGLVQEKVILQKVNELKLADDKTISSDIDKKLQESIKGVGGQKAFDQRLKDSKITLDDYKVMLKAQVGYDLVYNYTTKNIKATDQDVINYYYGNQYNYTVKPDTMNVSHILLPTEAQASDVLKQIKAGMKFEAAAKKYGTDGTKEKGGLIGDIQYNDPNYDADFVKAAMSLPTGKISDPVQTQFGFHIIRVNSRHEYKVKPLDTIKNTVKNDYLTKTKDDTFNNAFSDWMNKAKITKYTDRLPQS